MERLLFAKIELWIVALVCVLGTAGAVLFSHAAVDAAQARLISGKSPRYGAMGDVAMAIAATPRTVRNLMQAGDPRLALRTERFGTRSGWERRPGTTLPDDYLLLSRVDGDAGMAVVELVDLADLSVQARWMPDPEALYAEAARTSEITDYSHWSRERFRVAHPLLTPDGNLYFRNHNSPLTRYDACQNVVWMQDAIDFHHSTNLDADGLLWIPSRIENTELAMAERFNDHALAHVTLEGEVLSNVSTARILIDNGYKALVFGVGMYSDDPLHVNDIQPVLEDGAFWQKGDLFISMRHRSLIVQYRPSTGKIVWLKQGPWMGQHDVDIVGPTQIAVFNNNVFDSGAGWFIDGTSGVMVYDLATDSVTRPYAAAEEELQIQTLTEGLFDIAADGSVMIEEENSGRIVFLDPAGAVAAEFVNRAANGNVYRLGWSRLVSRKDGDAALGAIAAAECDGERVARAAH